MTDPTQPEQRLARLMRRMQSLRLGEFPQLDYDLTISQIHMLAFIARLPGCHVQDIAGGMGLSAPTVSVAVRRLEESGWLERSPDPEDGRAACISLTRRSLDMLDRAVSAQHSAGREFLTGLTGKEQERFLDLLEKAIEAAISRTQEQVL